MDAQERSSLEAAGYTVVADVHDWLGLSKAESDFINLKLDLRHLVRFARERAGLTQAQAARRLKSSQSRISKIEGGDPSVSLDLLVSAALTLGATREEVALAIAGGGGSAARTGDAKPARRARTRAA